MEEEEKRDEQLGADENEPENQMIDAADVDTLLMTFLQSALNADGEINPEVLAELSKDFPNIDFAELLHQWQVGQEQEVANNQVPDDVQIEGPPATPNIQLPDIDVMDLECDNEVEVTLDRSPLAENSIIAEEAPLRIIEAEGGITVCHDSGGDLRPKPSVPATVVVTQENPLPVPVQQPEPVLEPIKVKTEEVLPPVKVKTEEVLPPVKVKTDEVPESSSHHRHHHKEKKKDKDREERKRRKEKEQARERGQAPAKPISLKPFRHPAFTKHQKKFSLLDTSVTLIKIDTIMSVKKHMRLGRKRLDNIQDLDRKRQTVVNNKAGRIRLVPRPRPAYEFENTKADRDFKRHGQEDKKGKDDSKRKKIRVFSDSDSEVEDRKGSKTTGGKKTEKDHRKSQPHGEFSATGARILPFEKPRGHHQPKEKESERIIRRPKMPEPELRKEKDSRKERGFTTGGNKESEAKLRTVLQTAIEKQKAQMQQAQAAQQFKIPKSNQRDTSLQQGRFGDKINPSTPLYQIRKDDKLNFQQSRNYAPNTYGFHRQNPNTPDFVDSGGGGILEGWELERQNETKAIQTRLLNRPEAADVEDDNPIDMHDDCGSDDDEDEEPVIAPPPADDVTLGPVAKNVFDMLRKQPAGIQYPSMIPAHFPSTQGNPKQELNALTAITIQKCAWWFSTILKTSVPPILAIPINPETDDVTLPSPDANDSVSSFGHVSNPADGQCQINEISSSQQDTRGPDADPADLADEFCGRTLIHSEFRISFDDKFQRIFDLKTGSDYERKYLKATCTICKVGINGKRELGRHVRSENHRTNFKQISLRIMPNNERRELRREEEVIERVPRDFMKNKPSSKDNDHERSKDKLRNGSSSSKGGTSKSSVSNSKEDSSKKIKKDREKDKGKVKKEDKVERVSRSGTGTLDRRPSTTSSSRNRKSRSRSRSPYRPRYRRRSRSRSRTRSRSPIHRRRRSSPHRRSTSAEKVAKFLERTRRSRSPMERKRSRGGHSRSRSPKIRIKKSRKHPSIFSEKLKLQAAGKWTNLLEESWKKMEAEEQKLEKEISDLRDKLCDKPEAHDKYEGEWQAYWKQTYQEVEAAGHNPDTYDYVPGWKVQWGKRAEEMMEELHFEKLGSIRNKYGMDLPSLQRLLLDIPTAPVPPPRQEVMLIPLQPNVTKDIYTPFDDDLMSRPMSMSSGHSGEPPPPGVVPESVVTIDTVQKTWEMMTGQKMSGQAASIPRATKSYRSSTSTVGSADMDLDMELIEVLRLMSSLEDQLSILAPQVDEYFKRAETMELMSIRKSYDLLEDKDFVALLFQCRDKFMGLIRANILTRDVLKRMNKAVYGLTSVLDLEPCQRLRPKSLKETMEVDIVPPAQSEVDESPPNFAMIRRPPRSHISDMGPSTSAAALPPLRLSDEGWEILERIRGALRDFPIEKQREVAAIIGDSLTKKGFPMTDTDLVKYMHQILEPALIQLNWGPNLEPARRQPSPLHMLDGKREPIRGIGTALPAYQEIQCRAASPPPRIGMMHQHFQQVRGVGPMGMGGPGPGPPPRQYFNPRGRGGGRGGGSRGGRGSMSPRGGRGSMSPQGHGERVTRPARMRGSMSPLLVPPSPGGIQPLMSPHGTISPYSPRGGSSPHGQRGMRPQSWSPRAVTPPQTPILSYAPSQSQPGPSTRPMGNNESENIPPAPSLSPAESEEPGNSQQLKGVRKRKEKRTGEVFRSLDGSSVSSGSFVGSGVGAERERRFEVKKGSKSTLSNGSGTIRLMNSGGAQPLPGSSAQVSLGDLNAESISEAESGEIVSSDDAASVASSVKSRRRKFRQKMEAMKLVEEQRRRRNKTKVDKDLELWFLQRRPRPGEAEDERREGDEINGKQSTRKRRSKGDERSRKHGKSSRNYSLGRPERRQSLPKKKKKKERRRRDEAEEQGESEESERRRRGRRRRIHPKCSESHSSGDRTSLKPFGPLSNNEGVEYSKSRPYGLREAPPLHSCPTTGPQSDHLRIAPPLDTKPQNHPKSNGEGSRFDHHPPPIPALVPLPRLPVGAHSYQVVSSESSSPEPTGEEIEDIVNISSGSD